MGPRSAALGGHCGAAPAADKEASWFDRMNLKLEALIEVEASRSPSILFQETSRYVESSVSTVSTNVRRLCADFMRELLAPASPTAARAEGEGGCVAEDGKEALMANPEAQVSAEEAEEGAEVEDVEEEGGGVMVAAATAAGLGGTSHGSSFLSESAVMKALLDRAEAAEHPERMLSDDRRLPAADGEGAALLPATPAAAAKGYLLQRSSSIVALESPAAIVVHCAAAPTAQPAASEAGGGDGNSEGNRRGEEEEPRTRWYVSEEYRAAARIGRSLSLSSVDTDEGGGGGDSEAAALAAAGRLPRQPSEDGLWGTWELV
eukprot:SM000017S02907  [mRNA]  locus=s17:1023951:1025761:- [translate_table: standard]